MKCEEVRKPVPTEKQVLVKIFAASVNSWDWDLLHGKPYIVRIGGMAKPQYTILGADIAGVVEAVGDKVTKFKPGDEVCGDLCESGWGGFAEYACANENALVYKPGNISMEEAAAIPQAGVMAWLGVHRYGSLKPGQKVLMNGAGGGVGSFVIQLAKLCGAEITGVDHSRKFEFMKSLGADYTIDYTNTDFTRLNERYDLLLDIVCNRSINQYRNVLNKHGKHFVIGGKITNVFKVMLLGSLLSKTGTKTTGILVHKPNKHLENILQLVKEAKLKVCIDEVYPLSSVAQAIQRIGDGNVMGKVVVKIV